MLVCFLFSCRNQEKSILNKNFPCFILPLKCLPFFYPNGSLKKEREVHDFCDFLLCGHPLSDTAIPTYRLNWMLLLLKLWVLVLVQWVKMIEPLLWGPPSRRTRRMIRLRGRILRRISRLWSAWRLALSYNFFFKCAWIRVHGFQVGIEIILQVTSG